MKTLKLYTTTDARKDMKNGTSGIECSIRKWDGIYNALCGISNETGEECGLCLEAGPACEGCPLDIGDGCGKEYGEAAKCIRFAMNATKVMLIHLQGIKEG